MYTKENTVNSSQYNWIICICSTPDFSSFKYTEQLRKIEKDLKKKKINFIFITVGDQLQEFNKYHTYLNFNDSTIFMNANERLQHTNGRHFSSRSEGSKYINIQSKDPTIQKIRELMSNISNVNIANENLIFEKF
mmetsp:Transcript_23474/g.20848  ORF Transcript_23474/g.20848 Transcript_23474/m.20848 type:complete len:135 (-) Transcript_23474:39-443(-)